MRTFIALTIALFVSVAPLMAQSAADEAAVMKAAKESNEAWSQHDLEAFSETLDEHVENWTSSNSKAAYKEIASRAWESNKDAKWTPTEEIAIVFITPDVAIRKARYEITGFVDENGNPEPPAKRLVAQMMVKKNGRWLQAAWLARPDE